MKALQDGGPNPHFEGLHHGETDELRTLRLKQAARIAELEAEVATLRFQSDALQSAATQLVDLADKRDRLRIEVLILRDSCAAKADRIDRLGETVVRLSAALKVAGEALVAIAAIENLMDGGDWEEIEQAREIARAALQQIKEAQR